MIREISPFHGKSQHDHCVADPDWNRTKASWLAYEPKRLSSPKLAAMLVRYRTRGALELFWLPPIQGDGDRMKSKGDNAFNPQVYLESAGASKKVVGFRRKQIVFSQGDAAYSVLYIQQGSVKFSVVNESGKEAVVAIFGPGDFLGEGVIAGQALRMGTATAISSTTVLMIEKHEMLRALHAEHQLSDLFIARILARYYRVEADLIDQLFNSTEKRLARTLLLLAHYGGQDEPEAVIPKISQTVLAEMIGATRSRVNLFMNKFRKLGFIQYDGEIKVNKSLLTVVLHE
jgi:CRP/FNR family cyclic AMP-dependent transcriptional regulator